MLLFFKLHMGSGTVRANMTLVKYGGDGAGPSLRSRSHQLSASSSSPHHARSF